MTEVAGGQSSPDVAKRPRAKIATVSLAGCFGCHTSFLDIDERLLDLLELVEFDRSPLTDKKRFTNRCDIGFIEGGCANEENVHVLQDFRRHCDVLVAVGQCAIMGGLPSMRNAIMKSDDPLGEIMQEAYLEGRYTNNARHLIPNDPVLPLVLDEVYRCGDVVKIDYQIPGCAPSADVMYYVITEILKGTFKGIPPELIHYD